MYHTIDFVDFSLAFDQMNRGENFSLKGRRVLFDFIEDCEAQTEEQIELDVIALCCEFEENSIPEVLENYNLNSIEELEDKTLVIWHDDKTVIYKVF